MEDKSIFSADSEVSSLPSRAPLVPRMSSPANVPTKQIRRKGSFVLRVDSSEELPSPHASIFEALYTSANNSDESSNRIEMTNLEDFRPYRLKNETNDENSRREVSDTFIIDDAQFRYGNGTVLGTITEQKSYGTIRSLARTKSVDDMPNFPFLRHRDSFVLNKSPRRKHSFSLDDLALIKSSYHDVCAMIERETHKPLFIHEIYAEPRTPIHAPVQRPPTPEGMPSWTASQNIPRPSRPAHHIPGRPNRVQRFFGLPASGITLSSRLPVSTVTAANRSVSAPLGGRLAPRFRPPRSVYGPIDQHPFNNAPMAEVEHPSDAQKSKLKQPGKRRLGLRVRFTPSATARDSENAALQAPIESSPAAARHPMIPKAATPVNDTTISESQRRCTHRKGRRVMLAALKPKVNHADTAPPSNEYGILPAGTPIRNDPSPSPAVSSIRPTSAASTRTDDGIIDAPSRPISISSRTHLMSGAILNPSSSPLPRQTSPSYPPLDSNQHIPKPKPFGCWKCKLEFLFDKLDHWWMQSAGCLCFVCCGFDVNEDMSVGYTRQEDFGDVPPYGATLRGGGYEEILGPRRVVLDETPGFAL